MASSSGADSTVNAGGQVSMASGLDGAFGLTVDADTGFVLGYTGGAVSPDPALGHGRHADGR